MSHQFNDELISAYLDGELTAEEQALVEQKLSESPEHQQMLGELSALRESFQALPTYKLDERFGERVLRAAERNMLVHGQVVDTVPAQPSSSNELPTPASLTTDSRRGWRMAVGSVAAVAALVLVTLFLANRSGEVTNDPEVSRHEEKNARDKTDEHGDESSPEDSVVIESLAESDGRKRESGSQIVFDENFKTDSSADSASPSPATAPAGSEGGFGGGTGNRRAALGRLNSVARDVSKSPAADLADGAGPLHEEGLLSNSLDAVVIIEVARDQLQQRPVELALNRIQVRELQLASSLAVRKYLADQPATIEPKSNNGPEELKGKELQAEGGKALDSSDELLVVATASEITEVCELLRQQGLNARFDGNQIAAAAVAPLLRGRKLPATISQQVEGLNKDAKLSEAKKRNQEDERSLRLPVPSVEKADADKFAGAAVSPKPAPAAPAGKPKATKDEEKRPEKLPSPADSPAKTRIRRSVTPASKPKEGEEDDAKLEVDKPAENSGAIAGQDQVRIKNSQLSRALVESYRKDVSGSFFYRLLSGSGQVAELKQAAKRLGEADANAPEPQRLAKGNASRGAKAAPEDATAESAGELAKQEASPPRRLRLRFVIRTIDSSASEPATKNE